MAKTQTGPGGIKKRDYPPQNLTQEQRQWLWEQFNHQGIAPAGYGGERLHPIKPPRVKVVKPPKPPKPPKTVQVSVTPKTTPTIKTQDLVRYPHMFPGDLVIWKRFIPKYGAGYTRFDYDIKVGSGTQDIALRNDVWSVMQQILSKYRIDVVGYKENEVDIIEVKPKATASAIGQVLIYKLLWERQFSPTMPVIPTIVSEYEMPDMRYLTNRLSINYIIV